MSWRFLSTFPVFAVELQTVETTSGHCHCCWKACSDFDSTVQKVVASTDQCFRSDSTSREKT